MFTKHTHTHKQTDRQGDRLHCIHSKVRNQEQHLSEISLLINDAWMENEDVIDLFS